MIKRILKIGGAAIISKQTFNELIKIILSEENNNSIFVISSFGKITSKLKEIAKLALNLSDEELEPKIYELFDYFQKLSHIKIDFELEQTELKNLLLGIYLTKEMTNKLLDKILSFGEILSVKTILTNLDITKIRHLPALDMIVTNSNFNNAQPIYENTKLKVIKLINQNLSTKYLTEGFIAKDEIGNITTMGYESSNLTATLLADILDLEELTIITNVDGIRNYDPEIEPNHQLIEKLNYDDALNLAKYGLKLIYPDMIEIAKRKNIKIIFKNIISKDNSIFTEINNHPSDNKPIMLVNSINANSFDNNFQIKDNLNKFSYKLINYNIESEDNVCIIIYNSQNNKIFDNIIQKLNIEKYKIDNYTLKGFRFITSNIIFKKDIIHFLKFLNEK